MICIRELRSPRSTNHPRSLLMRYFALGLAVSVLSMTSFAAVCADEPVGFWTTPTIHGAGKMHYLPDGAYKPRADRTYKAVFALSQGAKSPTEVNPALDQVARAVNLYAASGVPLDHLKFVAVAHGDATPLVLNDTQYRAAFGVPNPNLPIIQKLRAAGVDVAGCGQAIAEHQYQYGWVDKRVTISLSAITTITTLENQGYGLVPL
jgi:intracellular sulfur oxidation DsrE/DsrF family protein